MSVTTTTTAEELCSAVTVDDATVLFPKIPQQQQAPKTRKIQSFPKNNNVPKFDQFETGLVSADFKLPSVRSEGTNPYRKKPSSAKSTLSSSRIHRKQNIQKDNVNLNFNYPKSTTTTTTTEATKSMHSFTEESVPISVDSSTTRKEKEKEKPFPFFIVPSFEDEKELERRERKKEARAQKERIKSSVIDCYSKKQRQFIKEDLVLDREYKRFLF